MIEETGYNFDDEAFHPISESLEDMLMREEDETYWAELAECVYKYEEVEADDATNIDHLFC